MLEQPQVCGVKKLSTNIPDLCGEIGYLMALHGWVTGGPASG